MKNKILHSYFEDGGGELVLPNVSIEPVPYHNFLLLLQGHNFPILCSYLIHLSNMDNCWETHISELHKKYRGKGYGKLMYENMINFGLSNNIQIVSSVHTSKSAKRIWTSLEKRDMVRYDAYMRRYIVK